MFPQLGRAFFGSIWDGLTSLPFFDTGMSFAQVFIGIFIVGLSLKLLGLLFGIGVMSDSGEVEMVGQNKRKKYNPTTKKLRNPEKRYVRRRK